MSKFYLGIIFILISAVCYGLLPIFALLAYKTNINFITLLFWRFALAAVCLATCAKIRIKEWNISTYQLLVFFVLGSILYTLQTIFYLSAIKIISPTQAIAIVYIYPILVALLSVILKEEKMTATTLISLAISLIGVFIVLKANFGNLNYTGILLALGAALTCSIYMVAGRKYTAQFPPLITTTFVVFFAAVSFFIMGITTHSLGLPPSSAAWFYIMAIAIISTVIAILAFFAGLQIIGATKAAILSTVEPLITMGSAALFLGNAISSMQIIGTLLIIASACLIAIKKEQPPTPNRPDELSSS